MMGVLNKFIYVLFLITYLSLLMTTVKAAGDWEFEIQRIEALTKSSDAMVFSFKPARFNKTTYVVNGNITFLQDLTIAHEAEVKLYHSSKGNNQFVLAPFRLVRQPFKSLINKEYRKYIMNKFTEELTDLPITKDENKDINKMFKWNHQYSLKNYIFDKDQLPPMEEGLYKLVIIIYKGMDTVAGINIIAKVHK